jgi:hypothetical protein
MKRGEDGKTISIRPYGCLLLLVAMAALLAPSSLYAGGCMDGKMTAEQLYFLNDPQSNIVKNTEIEYSAVIQPRVKSKVACSLASGASTDLICTVTLLYAYTYYISGNNNVTIKNPGMVGQDNNMYEKICSDLNLKVYYLANGKPVY